MAVMVAAKLGIIFPIVFRGIEGHLDTYYPVAFPDPGLEPLIGGYMIHELLRDLLLEPRQTALQAFFELFHQSLMLRGQKFIQARRALVPLFLGLKGLGRDLVIVPCQQVSHLPRRKLTLHATDDPGGQRRIGACGSAQGRAYEPVEDRLALVVPVELTKPLLHEGQDIV
jgi:hypothetical protein